LNTDNMGKINTGNISIDANDNKAVEENVDYSMRSMCPYCTSTNVSRGSNGYSVPLGLIGSVVAALFLGVGGLLIGFVLGFIGMGRTYWHCNNCGRNY